MANLYPGDIALGHHLEALAQPGKGVLATRRPHRVRQVHDEHRCEAIDGQDEAKTGQREDEEREDQGPDREAQPPPAEPDAPPRGEVQPDRQREGRDQEKEREAKQARGEKMPDISLEADSLKRISVSPATGGSVAILQSNGGKLVWPLTLLGGDYETDRKEAFDAGAFAAQSASTGSGSVVLHYDGDRIEPRIVPLERVAMLREAFPQAEIILHVDGWDDREAPRPAA